jgi:MinD superfamily P-loop ATPase
MEYLSRLTIDDVNSLILTAEPTGVGLTTAKRIIDLSTQLPIRVGRRLLALNKVPAPGKEVELADWSARLPLIQANVQVPFDDDLARRSSGEEPIDQNAGPTAREAVAELTRECLVLSTETQNQAS